MSVEKIVKALAADEEALAIAVEGGAVKLREYFRRLYDASVYDWHAITRGVVSAAATTAPLNEAKDEPPVVEVDPAQIVDPAAAEAVPAKPTHTLFARGMAGDPHPDEKN